jgi:hypothetical protein
LLTGVVMNSSAPPDRLGKRWAAFRSSSIYSSVKQVGDHPALDSGNAFRKAAGRVSARWHLVDRVPDRYPAPAVAEHLAEEHLTAFNYDAN